MSPKIKSFGDIYKLSRAAAEFFVTLSKNAIRAHGRFTVALAGGLTPESMYGILATDTFAARVDWPNVYVFWGDERCVHPRDLASNYRMAREALLVSVPIPEANIHRIQGELKPEEAASRYETDLKAFFGAGSFPRFDLILLGMGADGHTASLLPHSHTLHEQARWVVTALHEESNTWRVTLTAPVLNAAANVVVLVTGEGKAKRLKDVLEGPSNPQDHPIQLVQPPDGSVVWLLDDEAASLLTLTF
jgi:6-phosphogluconolactonase